MPPSQLPLHTPRALMALAVAADFPTMVTSSLLSLSLSLNPGYKFQFGHTYGHLTHDALGQTTLEKQVLDVTQ